MENLLLTEGGRQVLGFGILGVYALGATAVIIYLFKRLESCRDATEKRYAELSEKMALGFERAAAANTAVAEGLEGSNEAVKANTAAITLSNLQIATDRASARQAIDNLAGAQREQATVIREALQALRTTRGPR